MIMTTTTTSALSKTFWRQCFALLFSAFLVCQANEATWTMVGNPINGEAPYDLTGWSVAMSTDGNRVVIGAIGHDVGGDPNADVEEKFGEEVEIKESAGKVTVLQYNYDIQTWIQVGQQLQGLYAGEEFGASVSMSADGSRIAVGAIWNYDESLGANQGGSVRVYDLIPAGTGGDARWTQVGGDITGGLDGGGDRFGFSTSMSPDGRTIAVGAPFNDAVGKDTGRAHVFRLATLTDGSSDWRQLGEPLTGDAITDEFGTSVSLSADGLRLAVGGTGNEGDERRGFVRVLQVETPLPSIPNEAVWNQVGQDILGAAEGDESATVSLSANGKRLAIGAAQHGATGHVRVFDLLMETLVDPETEEDTEVPAWKLLGSPIYGEAGGDNSGVAIALSADGNRLAVGAFGNDGANATTDAGHVRVLDLDQSGPAWRQVGQDMDGKHAYDWAGEALGMSLDGSRVAIGSIGHDAGGHRMNTGQVRVFELRVAASGNGDTQVLRSNGEVGPAGNGNNAGSGVGDAWTLTNGELDTGTTSGGYYCTASFTQVAGLVALLTTYFL